MTLFRNLLLSPEVLEMGASLGGACDVTMSPRTAKCYMLSLQFSHSLTRT